VRITFNILTFDGVGRLEADTYKARQFSRAELAMASAFHSDDSENVVDAVSRFMDHGGRWAPSKALTRKIEDAVLGRTRCLRL